MTIFLNMIVQREPYNKRLNHFWILFFLFESNSKRIRLSPYLSKSNKIEISSYGTVLDIKNLKTVGLLFFVR